MDRSKSQAGFSEVSPGKWVEIEEGLAHLRLFEADKIPQLTHGLCHSCYQAALGALDDFETSNNNIDSDKQ